MEKLFGTDGIRGRSNCYPITAEMALHVGKALGHVLGATGHGSCKAVIGKDTRLSGYMLETALTSGLVSMGVDVFLVGPVPTPTVAHLTRSMAADVGIMITASHNPFDDNGIKIFGSDGFKISDEIEDDITRHIETGEISTGHISSELLGKAYRIDDARGRYIEFAKSTIKNQDLEGLKVVLDCANGASYFIAPLIFKELGAEVTKVFVDPDGYNINNKCGAMCPEAVGKIVRQKGADVGIAFDGDADRVIFCDERGNVVDGDRVLAMCALALKELGQLAKNKLVVTTMSNIGLHEAMKHAGIKVDITDVGDRQVIEKMRKTGASIGGEKSGHVIFMDHATTGDGIITGLQVLRIMKQKGMKLSELAKCMKEYPQRLVSLKIKERKPFDKLPNLVKVMAQCDAALGKKGRQIVRYSGTENKIRLLVEARTPALVDKWLNQLEKAAVKDLG